MLFSFRHELDTSPKDKREHIHAALSTPSALKTVSTLMRWDSTNLPVLVFSCITLDVTRNACYLLSVIVSYRDKRSRDFASGKRVKAFSGIERAARLKLDRLEAAVELKDLGALPGNRLEALKGDRKGQYSIRINDQWRICFEWLDAALGPSNVEIVDYH